MDKIILVDKTIFEFSKDEYTYVFRNNTIFEGLKFIFLKNTVSKEELENKLKDINMVKIELENEWGKVYGIYKNLTCDNIKEKDGDYEVVLLYKLDFK
jgi:hypothetical protein